MNTEEENNWQGNMTTPTSKEDLVIELKYDVLKTLHTLQTELKISREDSLNKRKEQKSINEYLLRNMMRGIPQGKPTFSTNSSKREPYLKQASSPRGEEK